MLGGADGGEVDRVPRTVIEAGQRVVSEVARPEVVGEDVPIVALASMEGVISRAAVEDVVADAAVQVVAAAARRQGVATTARMQIGLARVAARIQSPRARAGVGQVDEVEPGQGDRLSLRRDGH